MTSTLPAYLQLQLNIYMAQLRDSEALPTQVSAAIIDILNYGPKADDLGSANLGPLYFLV